MESQVSAFSPLGQRPSEMATLSSAHVLPIVSAGAHEQTQPDKNRTGKGGKRNGRPITAITEAILKLSVGESVLFPGIDIEHARYSTKTVRRSGYAIRFRSRSNGVRAERLA